jgi:primase-polymerase (primpol)-like protein
MQPNSPQNSNGFVTANHEAVNNQNFLNLNLTPSAGDCEKKVFPPELTTKKNWLGWKFEHTSSGVSKTPIDIATGWNASSNQPETWCDYQDAQAAVDCGNCDSVGIALTPELGLAIVDFDKVKAPGAPMPEWVRDEIEELDSYTEESCSGRGYHVLVWGSVPQNLNQQKQNVELWSKGKMFALSGKVVDGRDTIEHRDLSDIFNRVKSNNFGPTAKPSLVIEKYDSQKFKDLCDDNWEKHGFASRSEAAMSVLTTLAQKHGGDADAIVDAFEHTEICNVRVAQGKWPRLADKEIERAIAFAEKHSPEPADVSGWALRKCGRYSHGGDQVDVERLFG